MRDKRAFYVNKRKVKAFELSVSYLIKKENRDCDSQCGPDRA